MDHSKTADELADRALAATASLPFSVEEIIQKLTACTSEAQQEPIWNMLDQIMPTLNEAQLARVRVEFSESLTESGRRFDQALMLIRNEYGLAI